MLIKMLERNLADVKRWGIVRTIRSQSVAEHSYFVTVMVPRFLSWAGVTDPETILNIIKYSLHHDMGEVITGDIPTPAKSFIPRDYYNKAGEAFGVQPKCPDEFTLKVMKVLDLYEAAIFLAEEVNLGNNSVDDVLNVIMNKLRLACMEFEKKNKLYYLMFDFVDMVKHRKTDPLENVANKWNSETSTK